MFQSVAWNCFDARVTVRHCARNVPYEEVVQIVPKYRFAGISMPCRSALEAAMKVLGPAAMVAAAAIAGCAQAQPLSITMLNPKTNEVVKCAARQNSGTPEASLAGTVELCAKQLEARGFVRMDEKTAEQVLKSR
jgi:hypothetical protein